MKFTDKKIKMYVDLLNDPAFVYLALDLALWKKEESYDESKLDNLHHYVFKEFMSTQDKYKDLKGFRKYFPYPDHDLLVEYLIRLLKIQHQIPGDEEEHLLYDLHTAERLFNPMAKILKKAKVPYQVREDMIFTNIYTTYFEIKPNQCN